MNNRTKIFNLSLDIPFKFKKESPKNSYERLDYESVDDKSLL